MPQNDLSTAAASPWSRRAFLRTLAASGAAASFLPAWATHAAGAASTNPLGAMGAAAAVVPSLVPVAAVDDALRLWTYSFVHQRWIVGRLMNHDDVARAAFVVKGTPREAAALLEPLRPIVSEVLASDRGFLEDEPMPREASADRLAFAMGWLAHYAATQALGEAGSDEAATQREALLLRSYLQPGAAEPSDDAIVRLYDALWHRAIVRLHTLKTDESDVEAWMHRFVAFAEEKPEEAERLATAFATVRPDPAFFDPSDPIVATALRLRLGHQRRAVPYARLLAAPGQSRYARAVAAAAQTFTAAAHYLEGEASMDDVLATVTA